MADNTEASASAPPTEEVAKLFLDEKTGEKVSKTELKRRQKLYKKEEEKKAKEAAAPPKPVKKTNAEADEKDLNPNVCSSPQIDPNYGRVEILMFCSNISRFDHEPSTSFVKQRIQVHTHTNSKSTTIYETSSRTTNNYNLASIRRRLSSESEPESTTSALLVTSSSSTMSRMKESRFRLCANRKRQRREVSLLQNSTNICGEETLLVLLDIQDEQHQRTRLRRERQESFRYSRPRSCS